ncbi:glycosyltransferase [Variovorax paradoxus]|uniref:glycosyltransferase n=1 Tax=Variovorax paradoxus TaxID=34073 RepID=UPI0019314A28|nr:glycosyltransferase [Variovorax paradoxus]
MLLARLLLGLVLEVCFKMMISSTSRNIEGKADMLAPGDLKTSILIFVAYYLPGFKAGGPIRTISNMVEKLGSEFDFFVVTADRDLGEQVAYQGIRRNSWHELGKACVYYASSSVFWFFRLFSIIKRFNGDILHLNSVFSFRFSILPMLVWSILRSRGLIVIGPRGEFSKNALLLKKRKKRFFIAIARAFLLYRNVTWHASTQHEAEDIRDVIGKDAKIRVAIDIACPPKEIIFSRKIAGSLRIVFVSRIAPMKNLIGAIEMLEAAPCPVLFDVYGPIEDAAYWSKCQTAVERLPDHVRFNYCGPLPASDVHSTLTEYDVFYLPTLGENFGHVIAEALGCGLPVIISDKTPWRGLQQSNLGWDIPLERPVEFVDAIHRCFLMTAEDHLAWRVRIRNWALSNVGGGEAKKQNRELFLNLEFANEH